MDRVLGPSLLSSSPAHHWRAADSTSTSWMEITEQGKACWRPPWQMAESTPSGNSYLKY